LDITNTDGITTLLSSFLNVQSRRSQLSAGNVANADTPGYQAKELDFSDYLRNAARLALSPPAANRTQSMTASEPRVIEQQTSITGIDGNNVDVQREMTTMAEAGMKYMAGVQLLQSRLRTLRTAIREGR
jgi:flagellar basal-body rod protein FlgB